MREDNTGCPQKPGQAKWVGRTITKDKTTGKGENCLHRQGSCWNLSFPDAGVHRHLGALAVTPPPFDPRNPLAPKCNLNPKGVTICLPQLLGIRLLNLGPLFDKLDIFVHQVQTPLGVTLDCIKLILKRE